jgi:hypothetical protein
MEVSEAVEPSVGRQRLLSRFVKTLVYWPLEEEHVEEGPGLALILLLTCLGLGIIASFENLFLGVGLAVACLYGSGLARSIISR